MKILKISLLLVVLFFLSVRSYAQEINLKFSDEECVTGLPLLLGKVWRNTSQRQLSSTPWLRTPSWDHSIATPRSTMITSFGHTEAKPRAIKISLRKSFLCGEWLDYGHFDVVIPEQSPARLRTLSWNPSVAKPGSIAIPLIWSFQSDAPPVYELPHELFPSRSPARLRSQTSDQCKAKRRAIPNSLMQSFHCDNPARLRSPHVVILKRKPRAITIPLVKSFHCGGRLDYAPQTWSFQSEAPHDLRAGLRTGFPDRITMSNIKKKAVKY